MKTLVILIISTILLTNQLHSGEKKADEYVGIEKISKLKKYNPHAVWRKVPCKHCNGTGQKTLQKYDPKKNTMKKWLIPCPYCKGKGTCGMSKY